MESMTALELCWLLLLVGVSVVLGYLALMNLVLCFSTRPTVNTNWLALISLMVNSSIGILSIFISVSLAPAIVATAGLAWASVAYFLGQRFENPLFASGLTISRPTWLPMARLALLSASVTSIAFDAPAWSVLPIIEWIILGFVSAELAILRERRRADASASTSMHDRGYGIFCVNQNQGRQAIGFSGEATKYPYP